MNRYTIVVFLNVLRPSELEYFVHLPCFFVRVKLEILEDILGELQTARKYERIYTSLVRELA